MASLRRLAAVVETYSFIFRVERAGLGSLNEGQQVQFEIEDNRGKSSAINLRIRK
jgi:cold shock CspA family protein